MKDEIRRILERYNTGTIGYSTDVDAAAEAIAQRITEQHERAYLCLELLAECGDDAHQVDECVKAAKEIINGKVAQKETT